MAGAGGQGAAEAVNRRGFFASMLKAGVAFTILPPATTYTRLWKAVAVPAQLPAFNEADYMGKWQFVGDSLGEWSTARKYVGRSFFEITTTNETFVQLEALTS